jgi:hypothetical protein
VPGVERLVVRLADRAAGCVELRERLRQPHEVLEVRVRGLAALEALAHERAAVHGAERHVVAADVDRTLRVPGLEVELARRLADLLQDPVRIEADELPVDLLPCIAQDLDRLVVEEVDAELGDDAAPPALQLVHGRLVEDLEPRQLVDDHGVSDLLQ